MASGGAGSKAAPATAARARKTAKKAPRGKASRSPSQFADAVEVAVAPAAASASSASGELKELEATTPRAASQSQPAAGGGDGDAFAVAMTNMSKRADVGREPGEAPLRLVSEQQVGDQVGEDPGVEGPAARRALAFYWKDVVVVHDGGDWVARVLGLVQGHEDMFTLDFGQEVGCFDYYGDEMRLARAGEASQCAVPIAEPQLPVVEIPDRSGVLPSSRVLGSVSSCSSAVRAPAAVAAAAPAVDGAVPHVVVRHRLPQDKVALLLKKREAAKQLQLKAALLSPSPHSRWCVHVPSSLCHTVCAS